MILSVNKSGATLFGNEFCKSESIVNCQLEIGELIDKELVNILKTNVAESPIRHDAPILFVGITTIFKLLSIGRILKEFVFAPLIKS
jgi:hypothetical protein